ncbi:MAG: RHS repeat domain-containing protein, partial [Pseudomonadota bacterium]
ALTLVYDARNRLSRVDGSGGTVQANHYNGRGERVRKVAGALDRRFAYDESGRLLGEFDAGGAPLQLSVWMDDRPVAVVEGTALRYIETDHLNTPRALIDPARNVAVWRWDLQVSAFGEHAANEDPDADGSPVKFNLRFPGQYLDAETGLHYNYFRDYEAGTGRYVESDPIGLAGGIASYPYANSMPIGAADPRGEQAQLAWCLGGPGPCALAAGTVLACGAALQSQRFPQLDGVPEPSDPSTWRCEQPVCPPPPMTDPPNDDECVLWHARLKKNCQSLSGPSYAACITGAYGAFLLCVGLRSMSP